MGIIGKDFKYKKIENFLTQEELKLLKEYCHIRHTLNTTDFDVSQINADTYYYADPLMESLMLTKLKLMEQHTGKELLPTYTYWRMYTKYAHLKKHKDRPACEISVTINIDNDSTPWPIFMDDNSIIQKPGDAIIYLGCELTHWREIFNGDFAAQTFLHYVDKNGKNKNQHLDNRNYYYKKN